MNVSSWFRNWLKARRADQPAPIALNHSARLSLRKLEDRQVLSVSASFLGGVLDVAIDGGTDSNPQPVDGSNNVSITVDAFNQVLINGVLVDSNNDLFGVQSLFAMSVSHIIVHDEAGVANTFDLSGVSFDSGFFHFGGVSVSLNGGAGDDTITGSGFNDLIAGGAGNDSLRGGGGNDVYQFQNAFGVDTVIDAGGTADSLNFSAVTSDVTINLQAHTGTVGTNSVNFAVAEIDSVVGHSGGNDTLQGLNATSHWNIGAAGTDYSSSGVAINASGFETLQGGSLADTFHVGSSGNWTLKGGAGADVFDIDATFSGTLDGETDSDTLQGTGGNIAGPVTISTGDLLSPGDSPGILSTGNLAFANGSTFLVEIDDDSNAVYPGGVAGTDYDQMQVTGTVTIGSTATLNLQDLGSTQANARDVYTIISNDGSDAVTGTFSGLANGAVVTATGGITYRIFYNGGDGNDVVLVGRPSTIPDVFVSTSFVGLIPGALITDVDFITAGDQAGIYGLDGYATIAEAIAGVSTGGTIHVNSGTYLHTGTLAVNKSVTIDGQGMNLTQIRRSGAAVGNFDVAITVSANDVTISDAQLGWQTHSTLVSNTAVDYKGYVVYTSADTTTISRVLFGSNATGEGYRSAVVFEGVGANGADDLEVSHSVFEGRWGRAAIRDGDNGSGLNFLITHNEFREDHFRWGPIAIGPQDSTGTPNNFAFSGEISFNYFGNGLDTVDFQSLGNQNTTVTITNQGLTAAGLDIVHNTFDWNDSNETNVEEVHAQPAGVYITPSLTGNADQILVQDNIFNNYAYTGTQPGTTAPLWRPTEGVFGGALEFDGADDFGVWQSSLFDVGTTGTLNFWVQMQDTTSRSQLFEGPGNAGFEMQYRQTSGGQLYGRTTTVGGDFVIRSGPDGAALLNTWHNVQFTWDFNATNAVGKMHIYIDGVESGYITGATPNDLTWAAVVSTVNGLMNIGRDPGDSTRYFDGLMDDVGWFNSVLTAGELAQIRNSSGAGVASLAADSRLVAHWDFDQTTGNTAIDNKNGIVMYLSTNGIVPLGPTYQASGGHFGGVLDFDGVDDLATFQDPDFDVGEKGTLSFWVNFDNTAVANQFFEGPGNAGFEMQYRNNAGGQIYGRTTTAGGDFVIRAGGDAATLNSGDGWHNVQYTWDFSTGEMRVYLDGIESAYLAANNQNLTWASVIDTANGLMHMGYDPGSAGQFLDGQIDDVAWYNDVLTSTELAAVRTFGASAHSDLVANWKFDTAPTVDNTYTGDSGTDIVLYLQQLPPVPPVSGYGVVTPAAAVVLNNVFYNEVAGDYADSIQTLDPSNITGPTANPIFNGDQVGYSGTTLEEFYTLRFGSSAAYESTEFQTSIGTDIPHVGANQLNPVAIGTEDILVTGSDFDDLVVVTFTSDNDGYFTYTRDVTGATPDYIGTFNFTDITSFTFDGYGGDDVFIINQPAGGLFGLVNGIAFHGGTEDGDGNALESDGATGGDTLVLLSTASPAVIDSAEYLFGSATADGHSGTITLSDALHSTIITFTGTEPIRDELSVNERTFTFASTAGGGHETITVTAPGDTVAMTSTLFLGDEIKPEVASRTLDNLITSTLGPSVSFNNPHTLLNINAGIGDDTVNINSIHADYRAAMDINGDTGIDTINLNSNLSLGDATPGNTGNLTVTAETINVTADIATSGMGAMSLIASRNISLNSGSRLTTVDGGITLEANTAGTTTGHFVGIRLDNATITSQDTGTILLEGRGGDTGSDQYGIQLQNGAQVESTSSGANAGTITLAGTGGVTTGSSNYGVFLNGVGSQVTAVNGAISITGQGGSGTNGAGFGGNLGIVLQSEGKVRSTGSGTITVEGMGGTGGSVNFGVFIGDAGSQIVSTGTGSGAIQVTGQGGASSGDVAIGVSVNNGGRIDSAGTATITVMGTGGDGMSFSHGVEVTGAGSTIQSASGNISLIGAGGGDGTGDGNFGVVVFNFGQVASLGTATIHLNGTGGSGVDQNDGVGVLDSGRVTSFNGNITLVGVGNGSGELNDGVAITNGSSVDSTGTATITITGTGAAAVNNNYGVIVWGTSAKISSATGAIHVTGTGGAGTGNYNTGVVVQNTGIIESTGTASVTVTGTAGTGVDGTWGVVVFDVSSRISSVNGNVSVTGTGGGTGNHNDGIVVAFGGVVRSMGSATLTLTGTAGVGSNSTAIELSNGSQITSSGTGNVSLIGDSLMIDTTSSINASGNVVSIRQETNGTLIDMGGGDVLTGTPLTLGLTESELDRVTAGELHIGNANTGAITVTSDIDLSTVSTGAGGGTVATLCLMNSTLLASSIVTATAGGIVVTNLAVVAGGAVIFTDLTTNVTNLAIDTSTGHVRFDEFNGFTVTTVCGVTGIDTDSGSVSLSTQNGNVAVANTAAGNDIDATSGITVILNGANNVFTISGGANVRTTSGGATVTADNITLSGTLTASGQTVVLKQKTTNRQIDLGSEVAGRLSLTDTELSNITASRLDIGDSASGAITVSSDIMLTDSPTITTLRLQSGSTVSALQGAGGGGIIVSDLAIVAAGAVTVTDTSTHVTNLAISTTTGDVMFVEANGLTVTTVALVNGLSTASGSISLTSTTGNVTLANTLALNDISATAGVTLTLSENDATLTTQGSSRINNTSSNGVTISADKMVLGGSILTGQTVTLRNSSGADAINLGSTTDSATHTLELSDAELDLISSGKLVIGSTSMGTITISSDITHFGTSVMRLNTGAGVTGTAGGIVVSQLAIRASATVNIVDATTDVNTLAVTATSGSVSFHDSDNLEIGIVDGLSGLITSNADISLNTGGSLSLTRAVSAGIGTVRWQVASGNITQNSAGIITAAALGIRSVAGGRIDLYELNDVDTLSISNAGVQETDFFDVDGLRIGAVSSDPCFTATVGLVTGGGLVQISAQGDVLIDEDVNLGTGDLMITAGGNLTQNAGDTIVANSLQLSVIGSSTLTQANDVNLFGAFTQGAIRFTDADDLEVTAQGITTTNSDVTLTTGGTLTSGGSISLGTGNLLLDVDGDVLQIGGSVLAHGLALIVSGSTTLTSLGNDIDILAADTDGAILLYGTQGSLEVGSLTVHSMTVTGITTSNDNVTITAGNEVLFNDDIRLGGGTLRISAGGHVSQNAGDTITAATLGIVTSGGSVTLTEANDVDAFAVWAPGTVRMTDVDAVSISTVTQDGSLFGGATGVTASNSFFLLAGGAILIDDAVAALHVSLQTSNGGITQNAGDLITVSGGSLALRNYGTGEIILTEANDVEWLAVDSNGAVQFTDIDDLRIDTADGLGGITTTSDDVKITTGGGLALDQDINLASGNLLLSIDGDVEQSLGMTINANGLALMVSGAVDISHANDVNVLALDNGDSVSFRDIDGVTVGSLTVHGMTVTGLRTSHDNVTLNVGGHLVIGDDMNVGSASIHWVADGNISQQSGDTITAGGLGIVTTSSGSVTLNEANNVDVFATSSDGSVQFRDFDGLTVGRVIIDSTGVIGFTTTDDDAKITTGGNLILDDDFIVGTANSLFNVTGNLSQSAGDTIAANGLALMVSGTTTLTEANGVTTFAADNGGAIQYTDSDGVTVGVLTVHGMTVTGIRTTNDDVTITTGGNLLVDSDVNLGTGNLLLDVTGNLSQNPGDTIIANGLALLVSGTTTLIEANDVNVLSLNNEGAVQFVDLDNLIVSSLTVHGVTVTGLTTAGNLTLAAADDIDILELVTVAGNTSISAGQDGSGSFLLAGTGRLVSDNVANTANITVNTGATSGHVTLTGTITADNLVTVNSAQSINGAGLVTAQTVDLNAKTGIGNATSLELAAASISADTLQGNIDLDNARNTAVTFTSLTTGTGRITVDNDATGGGSATFTTVASSDGTIILSVASGRLTATTVTAGGAGDVRLLTTTSGDVIVGSVTAAGNDVAITSAGQINDNTNDVLADITAATTSLIATSGIGVTGGSLDVDVITVTRASAATGGVFLNLLDANNSGVTVTSATATTTGDIVLTATSGSGLKTYSNVNAHQGHVTISAANGNLVLGTIVSDSGVVDTHDVEVTATLGSITLITSVTSDDTVTLTAGAGGVTEQAGALISADKLLLLGTGPFSLTGANTVGTLAASVNGTIEYVDANSLIVGTVGVTQGITTSDDNVTLCLTTGNLSLAQSISTGIAGTTTGTVRLQTSGATSQVSQSNGSITASALGIRAGSGGISLNSSTNDVDTLAATTTGSFSYVDMDGFKIGTVAAAGCFTPGVAGLTANGDIEICVMAGDLAVNAAMLASGFTIRLAADTGSVTQSINGVITAENLGVHAQHDISLGLAVNNVTGVFAADSTMSGDIVFHDLGGFTVGSVLTNLRGCVPDVIGVTTASGDVTLSSTGGITVGTGASQSISASGRTVDLHAAGVTEADGSIIHAANLRLQGAGAFTLTEANTVGILAADIQGVLAYNDADGLIVGTVQGTSGLTTNNSDILLHANGNLTLDQSLDAGTADIRLSALGNITQSSTGTITADQLGVRQLSVTGGEISLDDDNDVNTFAASNAFAEGKVTYRDVDDLIVGTTGTQTIGQLTFGLTSGVTINHGAVHILTESGHLTLMQAVTSQGTGDVLLETRGTAGDVILNAAVTSGSGHISLVAGDDVDQNAHVTTRGGSIYVLAKNATADEISGIDMLAGTSTSSGGGNILLTVQQEGDIRLGFVNAGTGSVSLSAERSILNSGVALNLQAARLQMVADANHNAAGQIGTADVGNGTPAINANAINTRVAILAAEAADGIYVREADGMTVDDTGPLSVTRVNFNAVTDTVTTTTLEDLVTNDNGPIKLVTQNGTIVIRGGQEATTGVLAHGTGDVLLESRGAASDIVILAGVRSGTGNLTLNAADDVVVSDSLTTGDGGAVFITAANGTHNDAMGPLIDGINLNAGVTTFSGDILLSSAQDIRQTALIVSTHGDVGLIASRHVTQTATGDITTTSGDVLVDAVGTWTMNGDTTITAGGGDVLGQAGEDILLGVIQLTHGTANRVALRAGRSILDTNGAAVNVVETVAAAATSLSLRATSGTIGATGGANPTINDNALDLNVDTVAATSAGGIFLREISGGGAIQVDTAAAVTVDIEGALRANFNSTTSDVSQTRTLASLEDLTTTANGSIQLMAENGSITVNSGTAATSGIVAQGAGNLLLEARGTASDVVLNGAGFSGTGHVTLIAGDDVSQYADLTTAGGSIHLLAGNGSNDAVTGIRMANGTTTSSGGGNILLTAGNEGDISLGRLNASGGKVSLSAQRDILDNNGTALNVVAATLRMVADSNKNGVGQIGTPGGGAIETTVTTLAAVSADGIDLLETDGLTVDDTGPIAVQQVNFNSSLTSVTVQSLSDVRTTDAGSIAIVSTSGALTVNEGALNATDVAGGVAAGTSGSVWLEATAGDVVTSATVSSLTGPVTIHAGSRAILNAVVTTENDVFVTAASDVIVHDNVIAGRDLSLISTSANIDISASLNAGRDLSLGALVDIDVNVPLHADHAMFVTSGGTTTLTADADITTGAGGLTMIVGQLTTAADFTTESGPISITGPVVLSDNVVWSTNAVGSGGDITVDGTIDGTSDQAEDLTLTSGTADISVTGSVGATTKLGDVLVTQADETTFGGSFAAESFQQLAGRVTTFVGAVVTCGTVELAGTDGFQFTGHSLQFVGGSASLDTTRQDITITTDALTLPTTFVNATGRTVTIQTLSAATSIGLGDASQDLNFTDTQLDVIHSDNIIIGSASNTGGIKIGPDGAITQDENYTLLTSASMQVNGLFQLVAVHTLLATIGTDLNITSRGRLETDRGNITLNVARDFAVSGEVFSNSGELTVNVTRDLTTTAGSVIQSHSGPMTLTIGDDVLHAGRMETGSGPLTLNVADSMDVSGRIVSDRGVVTLDIGHDLRFTATAVVQSESGDITMIAGTATPACDGELFMADGAVIDAGSALVTMTADDDITLGQVITTNSTVDAIRITSNCAAIIDGGDAGTANIVAESATARVTLRAVTGIGSATGGGADAALEASVAHLEAVNASNHDVLVSGDVRIDEVNANGISIRQIDQQGAGDVAITSQGTIVVTASTDGGSGIHARTGSIRVSAESNRADLDIRNAIDTTGGNITLLADNDILIGEPGNGVTGQIQSQGGNITVLADDDANADAGSGGALFMRDGAVIDAATGTIEMRADEDITLASIQTANATGAAVTLVTRSGGVVDGGDTDRDILADSVGAVVTISAARGVGSGNALETTIAALDATNSTSGHVRLNELNAITLERVSQSGGGRVDVVTTNGTITVDNRGLATNAISVGGAGTLLLDANGTTSDIVVRDGIQTVDGAITLLADNDIRFDADGDIKSTLGNVTVTADQDNGGMDSGEVVMANGAVLHAGAGTITMTADGSITLGSLQTTNATTNAVRLISREGGVIDGGDTHRDIIADAVGSQVTILSATGVGSTNSLETTIAALNVTNSTSGNVRVDEQNALAIQHIGQQGGGSVVVTTQGTLTVVASGTGITSLGGAVTLTAVGASSDVLVDAPITVIGGTGDITLTGERDVVVHDTGVANDVWVAGAGMIRITATSGVIVLGSQNPNTTPDVTQHTVANDVILRTGTGAVTNTLPLVFNVQSPQVTSLGGVSLSMDIGRPGEHNITVTVFWGDGTFTTTTFADPGNYTFEHQYRGNPNPDDQSAPILVNVQVSHDPQVVLTARNVNTPVGSVPDIGVLNPPPVPAQNINTDLSRAVYLTDTRPAEAGPFAGVHSKVFTAPGNEAHPGQVIFQDTRVLATVIPVPGEGLASFPFDVTPPVTLLAIPEATKFLDILQQGGVQLSDSSSSRTEAVRSDDTQVAERLVTLEVLSPDGDVKQRVVLPETVLEEMLDVIGRLPDGKYRFQLQEPGEERQRLLLEFEVRQGKIADDTEASDRPPSATQKKTEATKESSGANPDGGEQEEAVEPGQSIMWSLPPHGIPAAGSDREPGELSMPANRADGDTLPIWGTWSSIAARRAWKRAEPVAAPQPESAEWSSDDTPTDSTAPTPNGHDHALAGSSVMLAGVIGLWAGIQVTAPKDHRGASQHSASLSRAAQLFRKYARTPIQKDS